MKKLMVTLFAFSALIMSTNINSMAKSVMIKPAVMPIQSQRLMNPDLLIPSDFGSNFGADYLVLIKELTPYTSDLRVKLHKSSIKHMQLGARELIQTANDAASILQESNPKVAQAILQYANKVQEMLVARVESNGAPIAYLVANSDLNLGTEFNTLFAQLRPLEDNQRIHMFGIGLRHFQLYSREALRTAPDAIIALQTLNPKVARMVTINAKNINDKVVGPVSMIPQDFAVPQVNRKRGEFNLGESFVSLSEQIHHLDADTRVHLFGCALRHVQISTLSVLQTAHEAADALKTSNPALSKAILDHANKLYIAIDQAVANPVQTKKEKAEALAYAMVV